MLAGKNKRHRWTGKWKAYLAITGVKKTTKGGDRQETSITTTQTMHRTSALIASVKDMHCHHDHHTPTHLTLCPKFKTEFIFMLTEGKGPEQSRMTTLDSPNHTVTSRDTFPINKHSSFLCPNHFGFLSLISIQSWDMRGEQPFFVCTSLSCCLWGA